MRNLLRAIYIIAILPLLIGSITFFTWYYKLTEYVEQTEIEESAFLTILGYFLAIIITLILCGIFLFRNYREWKKIIAPIIILICTFFIIEVYNAAYFSLMNKAYVRIINDTDLSIERVWSDNFEEKWRHNEKDFILSFYPVFTYDWDSIPLYSSSLYHPYHMNIVHLDLHGSLDSSIRTVDLPTHSRGFLHDGYSETLHISSLLQAK